MPMNPRNIIKLLEKRFESPEYDVTSITTDEEKSFASYLVSLINDSIDNDLFVETYESLSFEDESVLCDPIIVVDDEDEEDEDFYEKVSSDFKKMKINIDFEYKKKAIEYWHLDEKRKRSFSSVKSKFKKIPHERALYRWEAQVREGGMRIEKLQRISEYVLEQFHNAIDLCLPVHDVDLRRWGLIARENVGLSTNLFTASPKWVYNFKLKHGIVSRKVNKFITRSNITNKQKLIEEAQTFVSKIQSDLHAIGAANIYNSDQSGFNLELHAGRILALKGSAKIECLAQSLNSLTHSYTIQPLISANGVLQSPMLIVLKENGGKFGPIVEKNIYKADNIVTLPSSSGKLTSDLAIQWFKDIFLPLVGDNSVLCLDSWTGQKDSKFSGIDENNKRVKIMTIPAGTTGLIQPLDVYGFRPWKNFLKYFSDTIILYNYDINLHLRNNILKIQSLIHNQFSSPRFVDLFKYAWWKSGYVEEKPNKCSNPVDFCFKNCNLKCDICNQIAIIRCAWCLNSLCIQHFFAVTSDNSVHYCKEYILISDCPIR